VEPDLLDRILAAAQVGEGSDWEFKSARGGFPGSFWETYSAMANSDGGIVVLGVAERDGRWNLDGLEEAQIASLQKALWDGLHDHGRVSQNLLEANDVQVVPVDGTRLLSIRIPLASRAQRPIYLRGNPLGGTYRRRHEGDYRCPDPEVRRMLADADPIPQDHRIVRGFSMEDLDPVSIRQYRQRFILAKGEDHPWSALGDRDLLEKLGGWRRDRVSGLEGITLAGLLMLGKDLAIRDPEASPAYFVDYREHLEPALRWTDRIYPDGTWEANLFQFYTRVWPKLGAGLPTPFRLEGEQRRDVTPTHEALREAFVNTLIHADYSAPGGVVVERHPDRFDLSNPGTLLVSMEQYQRGGVSECRNPALQQMFLLIGGGEKAGSGADKIRSGWKAKHWRAPKIEVQNEPDRVMLTLPMISLIPPEALNKLRHLFGKVVDTIAPSALQALATAAIEGAVSNRRLQDLLPDHPVEITRLLARLCEIEYLESDKRRRWTTYRLVESADEAARLDSASLGTPDDGPGTPDARAATPDASPGTPDATATGVDAALSALQAIAAPVAGRRRAPREVIEEAILKLCEGRSLSAEQLSELLQRHPERLRANFLSPMTREGRLRMRFPEAPNRPDQAYTRADQG